ncbi:MAG TPA: SAM-dependent methyltransferase [Clostridiaceae bacterium]|nr:SAM-dependent methyltransferase [Clostridiaceae bacterium]
MELKGRLKLICEKVPPSGTLCDIGTDHAYIPIYLVQKGICSRAIATDIREGPLKIARENIKNHNLENKIETRLGYGLEPISISEAETIVIAGMGGKLITEILSSEFSKSANAGTLILQPMNAIDLVREYLYTNGFDIYDETLASEDNKIYTVINTRYTGVNQQFTDLDLIIGKKIIEKSDPLLGKYLEKKIRQVDVIIRELKNAKDRKEDLIRLENLKASFLKILRKYS